MKKLIARRPVLFQAKLYGVGESLPCSDQKMVKAWLDAKTAAWRDDESKDAKDETPKVVKAKPVTAEAGLAGEAVNGETAENLVGKVPKSAAREKGGERNGKKDV